MIVVGIDPGSTQTAICVYTEGKILSCEMHDNQSLIDGMSILQKVTPSEKVFVEDMVSYGMPVGRDVFDTVKFIGKLQLIFEMNGIDHEMVERPDVKKHHCLNRNAKDANVTMALVDRLDPKREFGKFGKGKKGSEGPFYGFSGYDMWSACAIAIYGHDKLMGRG